MVVEACLCMEFQKILDLLLYKLPIKLLIAMLKQVTYAFVDNCCDDVGHSMAGTWYKNIMSIPYWGALL